MIPIGAPSGPWPYRFYGGQDAHGATYWTLNDYVFVGPEQWLKINWLQSSIPWLYMPPAGYKSEYPNPLDDPKLADLRGEVSRRFDAAGHNLLYQFDACAPGSFEAVRRVVLVNCGEPHFQPHLRVWTRWERLMAPLCRLAVRVLNKLRIKTVSPEQFWAKVQKREADAKAASSR